MAKREKKARRPKYNVKLTPRQEDFCRQYVVDYNGTQAAIRAGYSPKAARSQSTRMLKLGHVQAELRRLRQDAINRLEITEDAVLRELAFVAFSDPRRLFNEKGDLLSIRELDKETAAALSAIEVEHRGILQVSKIKRWDKVRALELLARIMGMTKDRYEIGGADGQGLVVELVQFGSQSTNPS